MENCVFGVKTRAAFAKKEFVQKNMKAKQSLRQKERNVFIVL
jgi:hypothetical protein